MASALSYRAPIKKKKSRLVPVGNTAPWTVNNGLGGGTSSMANKKRTYSKPKKKVTKKKGVSPIRNSAPRARVPNIGNTGGAGMWGF